MVLAQFISHMVFLTIFYPIRWKFVTSYDNSRFYRNKPNVINITYCFIVMQNVHCIRYSQHLGSSPGFFFGGVIFLVFRAIFCLVAANSTTHVVHFCDSVFFFFFKWNSIGDICEVNVPSNQRTISYCMWNESTEQIAYLIVQNVKETYL